MASSMSTSTPPDAQVEDDDDNAADLPMTMAASVVLDQLPKDAHAALETAGELKDAKGEVKGKGEFASIKVLDSKSNALHSQSSAIASTQHEAVAYTSLQLWDLSAL